VLAGGVTVAGGVPLVEQTDGVLPIQAIFAVLVHIGLFDG
jgi:hypothetical protein